MNDSELPETAIAAGAKAILMPLWTSDHHKRDAPELDRLARAVLVAATERIECRNCNGHGDYIDAGAHLGLLPLTLQSSPSLPRSVDCPVCSGSGVLFVLKTEKP